MNDKPRFDADEMLGSLAKWLRILGYDTLYERDKDDDAIIASAKADGRILLTRDKLLAQRMGDKALYIFSDVLDEQLRQVVRHFSLHFDEMTTRCAMCNGMLCHITKEEARPLVPPRSLGMSDDFFLCQGCGKVYWKGTHWNKIMERVEKLR